MSAQPAQSPVDSPSMASVLFAKSFAAKPSTGRTPSGDTPMCAARPVFGKLALPLVAFGLLVDTVLDLALHKHSLSTDV